MTRQLPLATRSLLLRQFTLDDVPITLALSQEAAYRTWLPSQVYRDHDHAVSALTFLIEQYTAPADPRQGPYVLAIEHRAARELIGHVGFSALDGDIEIGFSIAESHQRQGLAAEAIVAATDWAFQAFGLERILAVTSTANTASQRAVVRAGFVYEGVRAMQFQGTDQSVSIYSLQRRPAGHGGTEALHG